MWWTLGILTMGAAPTGDPVLDALVAENEATMAAWEGAEDAPYFLGYRLVEEREREIGVISGALDQVPGESPRRRLDVVARVGSFDLDNTRRLRDSDRSWWGDFQGRWMPLGDDVDVLRHAVWRSTETAVHGARTRIQRVRTNRAVKIEDDAESADFSREEPVVDLRPRATLDVDVMAWAPQLQRLSLLLADEPRVLSHRLGLSAQASTEYIVTSEGTRIRQPRVHLRLSIYAMATAGDGMDVSLYRWLDVASPDALPADDALRSWVTELRDDLLALREAPRESPWSGPILLRGAAAGVFVHEVIGHRVEGHRQEDEQEGQTFAAMIGQGVTDPTISIHDDPTIARYAGFDLNGHYAYDQQGVPAQRATIVDAGVLRGFLLARDPIPGFDRSNGHGRAMVGLAPVARMANTIVTTSDPKSEAELRGLMRAELKRRGTPYGLLVDDLNGGFTMTGRIMPNAFNIRAVRAWRVYADGRPDELVRGVDLVGTPLEALRGIMAAGDDAGVFNGYCGAESGSVPNAAVSPSLLIRSLEVQKKETDLDRPPLLPKPGVPKGAS
jgi:predicted Zn-dependent protease